MSRMYFRTGSRGYNSSSFLWLHPPSASIELISREVFASCVVPVRMMYVCYVLYLSSNGREFAFYFI